MQSHEVFTTSTTGTSQLIAAPATGYRIRVVGLHLSGAGATKVTIGFSSTNQRVWNLGSAGQGPDIGILDWEGDTATALSVTNGTAVEIDVTVEYYIEAAP